MAIWKKKTTMMKLGTNHMLSNQNTNPTPEMKEEEKHNKKGGKMMTTTTTTTIT